MLGLIITLIILVILSGFFSGSETAIMSLSEAKARNLVDQKARGAILLLALKQDPHKLLITILIGNNLVNIGASVLATVLFTGIFGDSGLGIATGVMTLFVLVFGEITPKSFATKYAAKVSLMAAFPLFLLQKIFLPFIWLLDKLVKFLMKTVGDGTVEEKISEEEIKALIDIGAEEGSILKRERELLKNILQFNDIEVEEVMTPRVAIEALDKESTIGEAIDFVIAKSHSRIPVYEGSIDNVIGIVTIKDVLKFSKTYHDNKKLSQIDLKQPLSVPVSMRVDVLFKQFQRSRNHIAMVIDEYGGTAGLVSLEDLLEEIVGEIVDESDIEDLPIRTVKDGTIITHGITRLEDINKELGFPIKGNAKEPVSALILDKLRRFPKQGEEILFPKVKMRIVRMYKNKIMRVLISKL